MKRHKPRINAKRSITTLCSREAMPKKLCSAKNDSIWNVHRVNSQSLLTLTTIPHTLSCLICELKTYEKHFQRYTYHRYILGYFMSSTKTKISLRFLGSYVGVRKISGDKKKWYNIIPASTRTLNTFTNLIYCNNHVWIKLTSI